jgi:hypothetical protein
MPTNRGINGFTFQIPVLTDLLAKLTLYPVKVCGISNPYQYQNDSGSYNEIGGKNTFHKKWFCVIVCCSRVKVIHYVIHRKYYGKYFLIFFSFANLELVIPGNGVQRFAAHY